MCCFANFWLHCVWFLFFLQCVFHHNSVGMNLEGGSYRQTQRTTAKTRNHSKRSIERSVFGSGLSQNGIHCKSQHIEQPHRGRLRWGNGSVYFQSTSWIFKRWHSLWPFRGIFAAAMGGVQNTATTPSSERVHDWKPFARNQDALAVLIQNRIHIHADTQRQVEGFWS